MPKFIVYTDMTYEASIIVEADTEDVAKEIADCHDPELWEQDSFVSISNILVAEPYSE